MVSVAELREWLDHVVGSGDAEITYVGIDADDSVAGDLSLVFHDGEKLTGDYLEIGGIPLEEDTCTKCGLEVIADDFGFLIDDDGDATCPSDGQAHALEEDDHD